MTLCQYYDKKVAQQGYRSWNHFVAEMSGSYNIAWLKKQWKREYKQIKEISSEKSISNGT